MILSRRYPLSIALLSASGILLEISLTRLLSAIYFPQSVLVVLSLAILGIGLGAGLATFFDRLREARFVAHYIALAGLSALVLTIFSVVSASFTPVLLLGGLMILPYLFIGLAFSTVFSHLF